MAIVQTNVNVNEYDIILDSVGYELVKDDKSYSCEYTPLVEGDWTPWYERDFTKGEGQRYDDKEDSIKGRFYQSQNIDISTEGELSLAPALEDTGLSLTGPPVIHSNFGYVFIGDGTAFRWSNDAVTWTSKALVDATAGNGEYVSSINSYDNFLLLGTSLGRLIRATLSSDATATPSTWSQALLTDDTVPIKAVEYYKSSYYYVGGSVFKKYDGTTTTTQQTTNGYHMLDLCFHDRKLFFIAASKNYKGSDGSYAKGDMGGYNSILYYWNGQDVTEVKRLRKGFRATNLSSDGDVLWINGRWVTEGDEIGLYYYANGAVSIIPLNLDDNPGGDVTTQDRNVYIATGKYKGIIRYNLEKGGYSYWVADSTAAQSTENIHQIHPWGQSSLRAGGSRFLVYATDATMKANSGSYYKLYRTAKNKYTTKNAFLSTSYSDYKTPQRKGLGSMYISGELPAGSSYKVLVAADGTDLYQAVGDSTTHSEDRNTITVNEPTEIRHTATDGTGWTTLGGFNVNAVAMANDSTGWACANLGKIYYTENGWTTISEQTSGTTLDLYDIQISDTTGAVAVGGDATNGGVVIKTVNGSTWSTVLSGVSRVFVSCSIRSLTGSGGYIRAGSQDGAVAVSANGGTSWVYTYPQGLTSNGPAVDGLFFRDGTGWANAGPYVYESTTDGTGAWTYVGMVAFADGRKISSFWFTDVNTGWACTTNDGTNEGLIFKTVNRGVAWTQQLSISTGLNDIQMDSTAMGMCVGDSGKIYKYDGTAWSAQTSGTTANLQSVSIVDTSNIYVAGNGYTILSTDNGGTLWTNKTTVQSITRSFTPTQEIKCSKLELYRQGDGTAEGLDHTVELLSNADAVLSTGTLTSTDVDDWVPVGMDTKVTLASGTTYKVKVTYNNNSEVTYNSNYNLGLQGNVLNFKLWNIGVIQGTYFSTKLELSSDGSGYSTPVIKEIKQMFLPLEEKDEKRVWSFVVRCADQVKTHSGMVDGSTGASLRDKLFTLRANQVIVNYTDRDNVAYYVLVDSVKDLTSTWKHASETKGDSLVEVRLKQV